MNRNNLAEYAKALAIVLILLGAYSIFQRTGVINKFNLDASEINVGIAFLTGLVASVSTCLAVVGAVVIGFAEKYQTEGKKFFAGAVKPNLFFQIGRLLSFFILGGFLGLIGGKLNISGNFVSVFTIFISIILFWLGLNILGILPSAAAIGIRMPKKIIKHWNRLKESQYRAAPFLLGGLSFFLPCGFTQSMQILALGSGGFWNGGLILLFFSLGTMPVLLGLGTATSWTKNKTAYNKKFSVFKKAAGILIIFFAIFTLNAGLATRGINANFTGWIKNTWQNTKGNSNSASVNEIGQDASVQIVRMSITDWGFKPNQIKIKSGVPVRFVITGEYVSGCTNKIIIPSLGISKNIARGENIIEFTPQNPGIIPFSCWMGMVRGQFLVE